MIATWISAVRTFGVLALLTGVVYPLVVTVLVHAVFPDQATGSLVKAKGQVVGSRLLAQRFTSSQYFWPRPSAGDFATVPSGASNLGPTSQKLGEAVGERRAAWGEGAPADLLTTSASGLDPDISPAAAHWQVARVAAARGMPEPVVRELVERNTVPPQAGFLGEPRVNVLSVNLALDALTGGRDLAAGSR
jgi:potassium-transporting ATPase KdpC subunit